MAGRRKFPDTDWRPYATSLGHRIAALRAQRQLTQDDLANLSGVARKTVEAMELGRQGYSGDAARQTANPTLDTLWALASALDVSVVELLEPIVPPSPLTREEHRRLR